MNASSFTICSENVTEASLPAEIIYSAQAVEVRSSSFLCVLAASEVKESFPGFEGERKVGGERRKRTQSSRGVITMAPALLNSHCSKTKFVWTFLIKLNDSFGPIGVKLCAAPTLSVLFSVYMCFFFIGILKPLARAGKTCPMNQV